MKNSSLKKIAKEEGLSLSWVSLDPSMKNKISGLFDLESVEQMEKILYKYPNLMPLRLTRTVRGGEKYFKEVKDIFEENEGFFIVRDKRDYLKKLNEFLQRKNWYSSISYLNIKLEPFLDIEFELIDKQDGNFIIFNKENVYTVDENVFCFSHISLVDSGEYKEYKERVEYEWIMAGEDADAHNCGENVGEVGDGFGTLCCTVCGKMWDIPEVD